ncbi:MAG: hypothetical protein GX442_24090 [Candidatus Riflebacteria bacterium]|nr:hypothetical protein [Candidatus Riflebacteria bacterium]
MNPRNHRTLSGMTFLELSIGAFLLALVLLPLLSHYASARRSFGTIAGRHAAMNAADEILQQVFIIPVADLVSVTDLDIPASATRFLLDPRNVSTTMFCQEVPPPFSRKLTIVRDANKPLAEAIIRISWSDSPRDVYIERVFLHDLTWSTWLPDTYGTGTKP